MNKVAIVVAFSSLFFIAATFILLYVQLYDDYITAIDSSNASYVIFLMVMAGISLAILICIGGWLGYEAMYKRRKSASVENEDYYEDRTLKGNKSKKKSKEEDSFDEEW